MAVAVRLPEGVITQIDSMAARRGVDRSAMLVEMIERGFLQASISEITSDALAKITEAKRGDEAIFGLLDEISDRLALLESTAKR